MKLLISKEWKYSSRKSCLPGHWWMGGWDFVNSTGTREIGVRFFGVERIKYVFRARLLRRVE